MSRTVCVLVTFLVGTLFFVTPIWAQKKCLVEACHWYYVQGRKSLVITAMASCDRGSVSVEIFSDGEPIGRGKSAQLLLSGFQIQTKAKDKPTPPVTLLYRIRPHVNNSVWPRKEFKHCVK